MDIELQKVSFAYAPNTPFEKRALFDVDLTIPSGSYQAIIGHTGSGKSTILQHLNALLKPTDGSALWNPSGNSPPYSLDAPHNGR